jgi:hypothetical protein
MPALTPELVSLYIESAKPFAHSQVERRAIKLALQLNSPPQGVKKKHKGMFVGEINAASQEGPDAVVLSWKRLILKEIHAALCRRTARYRKEVDTFKDDANILIGAIAGYVAGKLGVAVAVVAALVAALLRLVVSMGVAVFCERFTHDLRTK